MSISLINHTNAQNGLNSSVTTSAIDTTGANFLIVFITNHNTDITTLGLSDNKGNTWHHLNNYNTGGGPEGGYWYSYNATCGAGHTVTVSSTFAAGIVFAAFSGIQSSSDPFDVQNGATDNTTTATSLQPGSITPSVNGELLILSFGTNSGAASGANLSFAAVDSIAPAGGNNEGSYMYYLVQGTAGAINPTVTFGSGGYDLVTIASFKASAGGGGSAGLFKPSEPLAGLGAGGPFFKNPLN